MDEIFACGMAKKSIKVVESDPEIFAYKTINSEANDKVPAA